MEVGELGLYNPRLVDVLGFKFSSALKSLNT